PNTLRSFAVVLRSNAVGVARIGHDSAEKRSRYRQTEIHRLPVQVAQVFISRFQREIEYLAVENNPGVIERKRTGETKTLEVLCIVEMIHHEILSVEVAFLNSGTLPAHPGFRD